MKSWRLVFSCIPLLPWLTGFFNPVMAQDFPNRPVKIVTGEAGGSNDIVSRLIAQGLNTSFGQPVIIDNRGGVAAILARLVAQAPADGHTLLVVTSSFWINPMFDSDAGYDPVRDFKPVSMLTQTPLVLAVNPSVNIKSVAELIAMAKAKPGVLNFASGPIGSSLHLGAALFNALAGTNIVLVPYKGGGPALNDFLGGRVQLMFPTGPLIGTNIQSGKMRAIAVSSTEPSAQYPGLPTIAASGVPGYEFLVTQCMFVTALTPSSIVARISRDVARSLERPDMRDKLVSLGTEPVGRTPEFLAEFMKADIGRMSKLASDSSVRTAQ